MIGKSHSFRRSLQDIELMLKDQDPGLQGRSDRNSRAIGHQIWLRCVKPKPAASIGSFLQRTIGWRPAHRPRLGSYHRIQWIAVVTREAASTKVSGSFWWQFCDCPWRVHPA